MANKVECVNFIAGDVSSVTEWLEAHPAITVIKIEFQSPFAYIVYVD